MCTVTWQLESDGYQLFFNRDERRERKPGLPPRVLRRGTTRFIAPLDGDFGGTWLGVNEFGLTLGLLNGYTEATDREPADGFTSRGLLIPSLMDSRSSGLALRRLARQKLQRFRSFVMLAVDREGQARSARWQDGELSEDEVAAMPLISSSFEPDAVREFRAGCFHRMRREAGSAETELHLLYHESHLPERGPFSTCMHRDDARTVSFNWIRVGDGAIRFRYAGHAPCEGRPRDLPVEMLLDEPLREAATSEAGDPADL